jgi:CheY-like chemotaxis protein
MQISQVVQNLILNASQAMPGGGTITLEARNQLIRKEDHLPLPGGDYIVIEVSDHGTGIDPGNLSRIFDPFFTTKSEGTGLGLSVCYSIVHNHGGHMSVYSEAGRGTKFSVYLPAMPGAVVETIQPGVRLERHSGRVLVMDDDQGVQKILTQMLTRLGFDVDVAANGDEAVLKHREAAGAVRPYRFVILDLTIAGGKGGIEALQEIRAINPGAKAVVSSGYSSALLDGNIKDHGFDAALTKPYTLEELSRVVSRILEV